jgi:hypothetical protein
MALNKVGNRVFPCFTPLLILNRSDLPNFVLMQYVHVLYVSFICSLSFNSLFYFCKIFGTFNLLKHNQILSLFTLSHAFSKSINTIIISYLFQNSLCFSVTNLIVKVRSVVNCSHQNAYFSSLSVASAAMCILTIRILSYILQQQK